MVERLELRLKMNNIQEINKEEFESKFNEMIYSIKENHKTIKLDAVNRD